jgi:sugar O-acyltransferase (sialic acid O-acetyltransferase NeuD family)
MDQAIGLGAGGHSKVVIEIIQLANEFEIVGLLDADEQKAGTEVLGIRVLGDDSLLPQVFERGVRHVFMGLGSLGDTNVRRALYEKVCAIGFDVISAIHPRAVVSEFARLGAGATIMASAVVNPGSVIGTNVIINTGAIVDHDCVVGNHVHVASGACLSGGVRVGNGSHIGAGAVIRQSLSIGNNSVVGAGSVVVQDVPDNVTVIGVPAKIYKGKTI